MAVLLHVNRSLIKIPSIVGSYRPSDICGRWLASCTTKAVPCGSAEQRSLEAWPALCRSRPRARDFDVVSRSHMHAAVAGERAWRPPGHGTMTALRVVAVGALGWLRATDSKRVLPVGLALPAGVRQPTPVAASSGGLISRKDPGGRERRQPLNLSSGQSSAEECSTAEPYQLNAGSSWRAPIAISGPDRRI